MARDDIKRAGMDANEIQVGKFYWVHIGPQPIRVKMLAVPKNEGSHYVCEDWAGVVYMMCDTPNFIDTEDEF